MINGSKELMMDHSGNAYGLWFLVILNSLVFIIFAFSFYHPKTKRDWRTFGTFSAFIIALFTEMYGFPLTIYLFSGWFQTHYPKVDIFSHEAGHLWHTLFGWEMNPHLDPFHILSYILIILGFYILSASWTVLYKAQKESVLARTGPYEKVRHPQYIAFILIMLGFLFQWPTLLTLLMFPVLVWIYVRLAKREEKDALEVFGDEYKRYMEKTPFFIPKLS